MKDALGKLSKWNVRIGEVCIYVFNPLVFLTALPSSFQMDSSSSTYVTNQGPKINNTGFMKVIFPRGTLGSTSSWIIGCCKVNFFCQVSLVVHEGELI